MKIFRPQLAAAAAMLALVPAGQLMAAPELEKPSGSLLDGLDGLLEGLPGEEPAADPYAVPLEGDDLGKPPESPLAKIESGMDEARRLIEQAVASGKASGVQQQVVTDLEELIKQAEKNCKQCNSASSCSSPSSQQKKPGQQQASKRDQPKPGQCEDGQCKDGEEKKAGQQQSDGQKPGASQQAKHEGNRSTERLDQAQAKAVEGRAAGELMKEVWGRLPQRVRERMLESSSDEFLPEYRDEIEQYFRQLAEQPE